jgi:hypothetical protein
MTKLFPFGSADWWVGRAGCHAHPQPAGGDVAQAWSAAGGEPPQPSAAGGHAGVGRPSALDRYCVSCHNERLKTADLRLTESMSQPRC